MDFLAVALAELANISERRTARLTNPQLSGLPAGLSEHAALGCGFGILQLVAASLVSENKVLAHPASVDSIPTAANQEDHVSMGLTAARKARMIAEHLEQVLAIECICAAQALDFVGPERCGRGTHGAHQVIRSRIPWFKGDHARIFHRDIAQVASLIRQNLLIQGVEEILGRLR